MWYELLRVLLLPAGESQLSPTSWHTSTHTESRIGRPRIHRFNIHHAESQTHDHE